MSLGTYADSSCTKKGKETRNLTERKGMLNDEHRVLRLSKHASLKVERVNPSNGKRMNGVEVRRVLNLCEGTFLNGR